MKTRFLLPAVILGLILGCSDDKPNEPITVAVEPASTTVALGQTQQFTAAVTGTGNPAVTWSVEGAATQGTITASGLYSPPAAVPNPATVTVRATSKENSGKSGTATITVTAAMVVTVSPSSASVYVNETQQFTATVTGDGNHAVTWSTDLLGSKGSVTASGLYTAPAVVPVPATVIVRARSQANTSASGTAETTILPPESVPEGFVHVPAGSFTMGDGSTLSSCGTQQHDVTLTHDFYLGRAEVTNQQFLDMVQWAYDQGYVAVTDSVVYDRLDGRTGTEIALLHMEVWGAEIEFSEGEFLLRDAGRGLDPDRPVKEVTWYGAVALLRLVESQRRDAAGLQSRGVDLQRRQSVHRRRVSPADGCGVGVRGAVRRRADLPLGERGADLRAGELVGSARWVCELDQPGGELST